MFTVSLFIILFLLRDVHWPKVYASTLKIKKKPQPQRANFDIQYLIFQFENFIY